MTPITDETLLIVFQLDRQKYCVSSQLIEAIHLPAEIFPIEGAPDSIAGTADYNGTRIPVIDLRAVFHKLTLVQYAQRFARMKEMHIEWVQELERCVKEKRAFTLATDPHKCQFGKWYDGYHTTNLSLAFVLKQLAAPHAAIHKCGAEIQSMMAQGNTAPIAEQLARADRICSQQIVPLLDRLIQIYREVHHGILLVVHSSDTVIALLVDEVTALLPHQDVRDGGISQSYEYLQHMLLHGSEILLEINLESILTAQQILIH